MGKGFYKEDNVYKETNKLAILMTGDYYLDINNSKVDFYVLKGVLEELLDYLGYNNRYRLVVNNLIPKEFHPGQSAIIELQGKQIGVMGKLHPNTIKGNVYALEIDLDKLLINRGTKMSFKEIPKYPSIIKDFAFVVDKSISAGDIIAQIKKSGGKLLANISIFDLYTGENVLENEKSIAFKLEFMEPTRTLTDDEVMEIFNKIISDIESKFNAKLRNN